MVIVGSLVPLQALVLGLLALAAPAIVLMRDTLKMILVNGLYGWTLAIAFVVFGAPDVALSMMLVSAIAYPLVVLIAIARVRGGAPQDEEHET